ncbi:MAG: zf-HC2 domain-containing protein [Elusimicrobia bacterium]|nr:zf-HC2 domain-containing protein [Elusimicrobiota bacterium]
MECKNVQKLLIAYLDGELDDKEANECSGHLENCAFCRKEKEALEKSWSLVGLFPSIEPSAGFRAEFWEKVRKTRVEPQEGFFGLSWAPALAGFLGIWLFGVGLGVLIFVQRGTSPLREGGDIKVMELSRLFEPPSLDKVYLRRQLREDL